ncbi:MAG: chromosome partitioning protein ParA, partial [Opitutaceae bacterium]|nr:chromosome partitioning protein ParA [Opitutaceae bacterium]
EAARAAAEAAAREAAATRERLTREREQAVGDARRLAELREKEALVAERARADALSKLQDAERLSRERAEREASRVAALHQQRELELEAERALLTRGILPADYKRRQHYYQTIEMQNDRIAAENAAIRAKAAPSPAPAP